MPLVHSHYHPYAVIICTLQILTLHLITCLLHNLTLHKSTNLLHHTNIFWSYPFPTSMDGKNWSARQKYWDLLKMLSSIHLKTQQNLIFLRRPLVKVRNLLFALDFRVDRLLPLGYHLVCAGLKKLREFIPVKYFLDEHIIVKLFCFWLCPTFLQNTTV